MQHFHVARVGRRAIEDLGGQPRFTHLLCKVGVFHGIETGALLACQKKVPQPRLPGAAFQGAQDLLLSVSQDKRVAHLYLSDEFVLNGHDVLANKATDLLEQRRHFVWDTQIHFFLLDPVRDGPLHRMWDALLLKD